ncbi:hypothetical protein IT6_03545 [Methylacidiphilum caldifontis]|uniref:hypothetical protein n=1 Tax=Methylacidiphilum caldifontis TaxID=2795386 RepID=UPI001A8CF669|nr:hypothetical protein [Methylacidiphilum caldifontis]QSR89365.1 hypothetical protein IT6_03545 [Methylacidiphilum caldifontis]
MSLQEFFDIIEKNDSPPEFLSAALQALFFEKKGNWQKAHRIVQSHEDKDCYWVHAFLHRKEGDIPNSQYWYSRAGKQPGEDFDSEWKTIALSLINRS